MSEDESSSDEELVAIIRDNTRGDKPVRVENYLLHTVSNLTAEQFRMHFRINKRTFEIVLAAVGPSLMKMQSDGRPTVDPKKQLLSVIWLLATPDSFRFVNSSNS